MSVISNGIMFYADTAQAETGFQRLTRGLNNLLADSRAFSREFPANVDRAITPFAKLGDIVRRNYDDIHDMTYRLRQLSNQMNSVVMSGVAVSMTGVTFMNTGRAVTGYFTEAVKKATDFEKTMAQISFLGGFSEDVKNGKKQLEELQNEIMKVATTHPTSNKGMAEGMLAAMRAGYQDPAQAKKMMLPIADLTFLSMDKLKEDESLKFLNAYLKTMNKDADYARTAVDKIAKTADLFTTDIAGLWKNFQSTRAAFENIGFDEMIGPDSSFLTMMGMMSTLYKDKAAGDMLNAFGRGMIQANGAGIDVKNGKKSARGSMWNSLGIDLNKENDFLNILEKINAKSKELWGHDKGLLKNNLIDMFGIEGLPVLQMFDRLEDAKIDLQDMRDQIEGSAGYSKKFMDYMMNTSYGTQKILEGTKETFDTLMGIAVLGPVNWGLKGLSTVLESLSGLAQKHPQLAKYVATFTLLGGAFTLIAGGALLVVGAMMSMYGSIASAIISFGAMNATMDTFNKGMTSIGSIWSNLVGGPMKRFMFSMLRMVAVTGLLYFAWSHNFMGMKDFTTKLTNSLGKARDMSVKFVKELNGMQYAEQMKELTKNDPLTAWFTDKMSKARAFAILFKGLWSDDKLTAGEVGGEDEFRRLMSLWDEMGLLSKIDTILDWKHNLSAMWDGFIVGMNKAGAIFLPIFQGIGKVVMWLYDKFSALGSALGFFSPDDDQLKSKFQKVGEVIGWVAGMMLGVWMVSKAWRMALKPIIGIFTGIWSKGVKTVNLFKKLKTIFSGMDRASFLSKMFKPLQMLTKLLARLTGLPMLFPKAFNRNGSLNADRWQTRGRPSHPNDVIQRDADNLRRMHRDRAEAYRENARRDREAHARRVREAADLERGVNRARAREVQHQQRQQRRLDTAENRRQRTLNRQQARRERRGWTPIDMGGRQGRVNTVRGQGIRGRLKDLLYGRQYDVTSTTSGRSRVRYTDPTGRVREFNSPQRFNNPPRRQGGLLGRMSRAWSQTFGRGGMGIVAGGGWGGGGRAARAGGRGGAGALAGNLTRMGPTVGRSFGQGLFKSLTAIFRSGGPIIGKVLKVGLMGALKVGLRAIPIVGELLLAWDLITLVWSNWDAIEKGFKKAWDWIKGYLSDASWIPGWLKQILGLQEITNPVVKALTPSMTPEQKERYDIDKNGFWKSQGNAFTDAGKATWNALTSKDTWSMFSGENMKKAGSAALDIINPFDGNNNFPGNRTGLDFVPQENYLTRLHKGEMVLDNQDATTLRGAMGNGTVQDALQSRMKPSASAASTATTETPSQSNSSSVAVSFAPGSVVIQMQNGSQGEIEKAAEALFQKFKRKVELENMRNYRPSRG